ncbi:hypothetical protein K4A07_16650, partial [Lactiplantibacillus plantarum]|nr:hypothetical protein [Lactiplantibacillus plantarum]
DQLSIVLCGFHDLCDLLDTGHVNVALLLENDDPSFLAKLEIGLAIEKRRGQNDRHDSAEEDERHLLRERQYVFGKIHRTKNEANAKSGRRFDISTSHFGVRWHARLCIGVRRLCVRVPQEDWRRTAAERIEAGAQATVEDRFVPSGEIVLLAGKSPVIHHRAPHAFADGGASSKAAPSE